jgi:hypothetical protein
MEYDFIFFFRGRKQFIEVYLWPVHPTTFANWGGGRWGYFHATYINPKAGKFGELHFVKSRLRFDVIVHELDHVRTAWMWANGETITRKNEERMASKLDELAGSFRRELRKFEPRIQL